MILLDPFSGTRQQDNKGRKCQFEDGGGKRKKGIGRVLVPVRCLSIDGQIHFETVSVLKVMLFIKIVS